MGIYDREYYRGETRGSAWLSGASPVCNALIIINVAVFLFQNFAKLSRGRRSDQHLVRGVRRRDLPPLQALATADRHVLPRRHHASCS